MKVLKELSPSALSALSLLAMIIRQFCARHGMMPISLVLRSTVSLTSCAGRSAFARSPRLLRTYETVKERVPDDKKPGATLPGHPDEASSILDTTSYAPTASTREVEAKLNSLNESAKSLEASLNAHITSRILSFPDEPIPAQAVKTQVPEPFSLGASEISPPPFETLPSLYKAHRGKKKAGRIGTSLTQVYNPNDLLSSPPRAAELTLPMILANQAHLGHHTALWHPSNSRYIFGIRHNIHIISLDVIFAHLRRAAKVTQEIARRGGLILFVGTRPGFTDIVINSARRANAYHIFSRWVPGTLTNGQQILEHCATKVVNIHDQVLPEHTRQLTEAMHSPLTTSSPNSSPPSVLKPDLVIVLNCPENQVCLHECGLHNVPTIGIVDTDVNPSWVTYPVPANDDSLRSVALVAGVLSRAAEDGQRQRLDFARKHGRPNYSTIAVERMLKSIGANADPDPGTLDHQVVLDGGASPTGSDVRLIDIDTTASDTVQTTP